MIEDLRRAIGETLQRRWHSVWTQEDYAALKATLAGMETFINAFEESERRRELAEADNAALIDALGRYTITETEENGQRFEGCSWCGWRATDHVPGCEVNAIVTTKHPGAQIAVVVEAARQLVAVRDTLYADSTKVNQRLIAWDQALDVVTRAIHTLDAAAIEKVS